MHNPGVRKSLTAKKPKSGTGKIYPYHPKG